MLASADILLGVTPERIVEAFGAESERLSQVLAGVDDAALAGASGCPPWSVAELAYHVRMTIGRLPGMVDAAEPTGPGSAWYPQSITTGRICGSPAATERRPDSVRAAGGGGAG